MLSEDAEHRDSKLRPLAPADSAPVIKLTEEVRMPLRRLTPHASPIVLHLCCFVSLIALAGFAASTARGYSYPPHPQKPAGWYWSTARAAVVTAAHSKTDAATSSILNGTSPTVACTGLQKDVDSAEDPTDYRIAKNRIKLFRYFNCIVTSPCLLAPWHVHVYVTRAATGNLSADAQRIRFVNVGQRPLPATAHC